MKVSIDDKLIHSLDIITKAFKYKKLRKVNYTCELSGDRIDENCLFRYKYRIHEIFSYVNNNTETLYWIFDKMWEEWLIVCKRNISDIHPSTHLNLPLDYSAKQKIDKIVENLKTPLGMNKEYKDKYDSTLLFPVPRLQNRLSCGYIDGELKINGSPLVGLDIWQCDELSYLDYNGKPQSKILRIGYDCHSKSIIESKSLKLYLNSFNQESTTIQNICSVIKNDLNKYINFNDFLYKVIPNNSSFCGKNTKYESIDSIETVISTYKPNPYLLEIDAPKSYENIFLCSELLRSNCRQTKQPDWATAYISYKPKLKVLKKESLLKYLISYRLHLGFHEETCENIILDLVNVLDPKWLRVELKYTRRGGISINPIRIYDPDDILCYIMATEFNNFQTEYRQ